MDVTAPLDRASTAALQGEGSEFLPLIANPLYRGEIAEKAGNGIALHMGEFQGAFALCSVRAAEFLDSLFRRIDPDVLVEGPTAVYLTYRGSRQGATVQAAVSTATSDGAVVSAATQIVLEALGNSTIFLGSATLEPLSEISPRRPMSSTILQVPAGLGRLNGVVSGVVPAATASAATASPVKLRIAFLDESGQNVSPTPIVKVVTEDHPVDTSRKLQVEEAKIQIEAVAVGAPAGSGQTILSASGSFYLCEAANSGLQPFQQYSYRQIAGMGRFVTVLQKCEDDQRDSAAFSNQNELLILGRSAVIAIRSLSLSRDTVDGSWIANLQARPASPGRGLSPDTTFGKVPQWADQGSYTLASDQIVFQRGPGNGVADWLERGYYRRLKEMQGGSDALEKNVASAVGGLWKANKPNPELPGCASLPPAPMQVCWVHPPPNSPFPFETAVRINMSAALWQVDPIFYKQRLNQSFDNDYWGLNRKGPHVLDEAITHEARHCWQNALGNFADIDGDGAPLLLGLDGLATHLKDSPNTDYRQYGENPEFDLLGASSIDDEGVVAAVRERDAMLWGVREGTTASFASKLGSVVVLNCAPGTPVTQACAGGSLIGWPVGSKVILRVVLFNTDGRRHEGTMVRLSQNGGAASIRDRNGSLATFSTGHSSKDYGAVDFEITVGSGAREYSTTVRHPGSTWVPGTGLSRGAGVSVPVVTIIGQ